jgi:hypothetical protein
MMKFLSRVEQTGFSTWVRGSPFIFIYPMILFPATVDLGSAESTIEPARSNARRIIAFQW